MTPGPPKQFDREAALARALRLFWKRGYDAVGVTELLAEMGIGRQSMYDTFGTKRELFLAALQAYVDAQRDSLRGALLADGRPLENLRRAFDYWKQLLERGDGCFAGNTFSGLAPRDEEVATVVQRAVQESIAAFREVLERAVAEGDLRPDTDAEGLAHLVFATGQGVAALSQLPAGNGLANDAWAQLERMIEGCRA